MRVSDLLKLIHRESSPIMRLPQNVRYTNAKVIEYCLTLVCPCKCVSRYLNERYNIVIFLRGRNGYQVRIYKINACLSR